MIIISELTGKEYKTVEECKEAEEIFLKKKEEEAKAKKAHEEELDKAYEEAIAACDRYLRLRGIEIEEDENSFIATFKGDETNELFEKFFELMF
jgi:hypothetical protein